MNELVVIRGSTEYFKYIKKHGNKLYEQGRNFEYATMKVLRKHGYYCIRKFGSKGFEDIVATKQGSLLFVQCKHSNFRTTTPEDDLASHYAKGLIDLAERYGGLAIFAGVKKRRMYFMKWEDGKWKTWTPK